MATHIFNVPDIGEGTAVAELSCWHVKVGDIVDEDQSLADLITDKATVEIPSPMAGRVIACHGKVGEELAVGSPFVEFESTAAAPESDPVPTTASADQALSFPALSGESSGRVVEVSRYERLGKPVASPAVRHRAKEMGIDLEAVRGSGPAGRIRQADLETYLAYRPERGESDQLPVRQSETTPNLIEDVCDVPLIGLRRKIAQKMEVSTRTIPHFSYVEEVDMSALEAARERLNEFYDADRPKLTVLPFLITAMCRILPSYPQINAQYDEASSLVRQHRSVHIGIATQTVQGLIVPVIRNAERRGLWELAAEIKRLSNGARDSNLPREQLSGSTITITSLGRLGGVVTTPVINHPEVAIIGPNNIVERPVAIDGAIVLRKMMNISSSFDHRVVDGHDAAMFIREVRRLLEEPAALLAA